MSNELYSVINSIKDHRSDEWSKGRLITPVCLVSRQVAPPPAGHPGHEVYVSWRCPGGTTVEIHHGYVHRSDNTELYRWWTKEFMPRSK